MKDQLLSKLTAGVESADLRYVSQPETAAIVAAVVELGDILRSEQTGDHGCSYGFTGQVVALSESEVTLAIIASTDCSSCWQTGCNGSEGDNAHVGKIAIVPFEKFRLTDGVEWMEWNASYVCH